MMKHTELVKKYPQVAIAIIATLIMIISFIPFMSSPKTKTIEVKVGNVELTTYEDLILTLKQKSKMQDMVLAKYKTIIDNDTITIEELSSLITTLELKLKQTTIKYHECIDNNEEKGD